MRYKNILDTIGNTPMVKIQKLNPNPSVSIFAKLEGNNPGGSVKDRIALAMIEEAEKKGILTKDKTIIEPTSGNTGISLAMIGIIKGYKVKLVMPETMSIEKRKIIRAFGAELILVKKEQWRDAAIRFVKRLVKQNKNLVMLNQYENKTNVMAHYETTGKEILKQMKEKKIDVFIAGIGTGGTITGVGQRLKEKYPDIKIIGVEPNVETKIEGLRSTKEYLPPIFNYQKIDQKVIVKDKDAFRVSRLLMLKEGISVGISSGAAMWAAINVARSIKKGNIVVLFPDRGGKYLSTELFN